MSVEEWRPIPGFEGHYSISSLGRVRSEHRVVLRINGWPFTVRERILQQSGTARQPDRRAVTLIRRGRKKRTYTVHGLVREVFGDTAARAMREAA